MTDNELDFENWPIPELEQSATSEIEETTLFGKPATWYTSEQTESEEKPTEKEPQPLTLEDIEAIRQLAYEDGFQEGKETGFAQGLDEGKSEGLQNGLQEGLEQGLREGLLEGQEQIDKQVTSWQALIERLHNPLQKLDDNVEHQLIRLVTSLAEQITRCELQTNPQIILQALKQAVEVIPVSEQTLKILLHPEDLQFVHKAYSPEVCLKRGWDLQAEAVLARGDCQIHTQVSSVDYAFSTRVEQVLKHFFKENHQQLPPPNDDSDLLNDHPIANDQDATASQDVINE